MSRAISGEILHVDGGAHALGAAAAPEASGSTPPGDGGSDPVPDGVAI